MGRAQAGPILQTERLVLRPHGLDDFEDSFAMWSDPATTRFVGGRPATEEEAWARLMRYAGFWALLGHGFWVARELGSGRFVGEVGAMQGRRGLGARFADAPEVGWALAPAMQGQGLAQEALGAVLDWGEAQGWRGTVCLIHPENAPSRRLAERNGYRPFEETSFKGEPTILFERLRS